VIHPRRRFSLPDPGIVGRSKQKARIPNGFICKDVTVACVPAFNILVIRRQIVEHWPWRGVQFRWAGLRMVSVRRDPLVAIWGCFVGKPIALRWASVWEGIGSCVLA
jgi:hypothetical protein